MGCMLQSRLKMKRINILADGSCLFYSIDYLMTGIKDDPFASLKLRHLCIDKIKTDPYFTLDTLGENKTVDDYCQWLEQQTTYGGGNELAILSKYYEINIVIISCIVDQPCIVLGIYSPAEKKSNQFIHLLYNGQHYDALVSIDDERIFDDDRSTGCLELAKIIKEDREKELKTRKRTKLKCECGSICDSNDDWKNHISDMHINDEEFNYLCETIELTEIVANINDE